MIFGDVFNIYCENSVKQVSTLYPFCVKQCNVGTGFCT